MQANAPTQAARRRSSIRLSHPSSWFQLAKMRLSILGFFVTSQIAAAVRGPGSTKSVHLPGPSNRAYNQLA